MNVSGKMPSPRHDVIIEPFAGSASYSVRYGEGRKVRLYDLDPQVVAIWDYLLGASEADIRALPGSELGDTDIRTLGVSEPAKLLMQRWLTPQGSNSNWWMPPAALSLRERHPRSFWSTQTRDYLASVLKHLSRWEIHQKSWREAITSEEATWIIDPPYQHNKMDKYAKVEPLDYQELALAVQGLRGQVFVHEQEGADWLDFQPFFDNHGGRIDNGVRCRRMEVLWSRDTLEDDLSSLMG